MEWVVVVMMLALLEYFWMSVRVGLARGRTGVEAPAVSGNEEFERYFRVHYNTMEQLVMFLPGIWFFALYVNELLAAAIGVVFLIGRALYAVTYVKDPASRAPGVLLSVLSSVVLVAGALVGALYSLLF